MMTTLTVAEPVLIIDDEPAVLRMLVKCLERVGFRTDTAMTGEKALEKLKTIRYGLIMTDIQMPGISGNQVADVLKKGLNSATPVIVIPDAVGSHSGFDRSLYRTVQFNFQDSQ